MCLATRENLPRSAQIPRRISRPRPATTSLSHELSTRLRKNLTENVFFFIDDRASPPIDRVINYRRLIKLSRARLGGVFRKKKKNTLSPTGDNLGNVETPAAAICFAYRGRPPILVARSGIVSPSGDTTLSASKYPAK